MAPRSNRIKEVKWELTVSGATSGSFAPNVGSQVINGEVLEVNWQANRAGSIVLFGADTSEEFFRRNAPSGSAGFQVTRPATFTETTTGSIANAEHVPFVINDVPWLELTGYASGTQTLDVNVKYR